MHTHRSKTDGKIQLTAIRKSCRSFFIEVVSGLCFGQSTTPEDKLIEMLLNIVFTERGEGEEEGGEGEGGKRGTRDLTPYKEDLKERDKSPIIRSFLLQLLLEHEYVCVYVFIPLSDLRLMCFLQYRESEGPP